jgi:thioredoxin reductase
MYDAIIVGGGPAGLAAAQTLGRSLRATLVLDSGEPRNGPAAHMHNFLSRDGTPPAELRQIAREELGRYTTVELRDLPALTAEALPEGGFAVGLPGGGVVEGRQLLLATGVVDDLPPIEGLASLWGRAVFHCPYCHGYETRGTRLAVLGGTPAAVNLALHLRRFSHDVVLCTHGPAELDPALTEALARNGVPVREEPVGKVEGRDGRLERIVFEGGDVLPRDAMFCAIAPLRQRSELPRQLGCRMLEDDSVEVDELGRTSVPGVYTAGDMARRANGGRMPAVIAAAASGALAGAALDKDLLAIDTGLAGPVPAAARTA